MKTALGIFLLIPILSFAGPVESNCSFLSVTTTNTPEGPRVCLLMGIEGEVEYRIEATDDGFSWVEIGTVPANDQQSAFTCILANHSGRLYRLREIPPIS